MNGLALGLDIGETFAYFAAPALLWLFVYLLAYRDAELAAAAGFDRLTFWLLIPGAILGEFANVLVFGTHGDLLAVNVGGGLIPAALALWLLYRILPEHRRGLLRVLLGIVAGSGAALAAVILLPAGALSDAVAATSLVLPAVVAALWAAPAEGAAARTRWLDAGLLGLFGTAALATFATTATIPGTGIVSSFPAYLVLPVAAGVGSTLVLREGIGLEPGPCLAVAYGGVTLGELVGADVLHQPPLYLAKGAALYAIGGAGVLDLLHLSGLLALAGAAAVVRLASRESPRRLREPALPSSPVRRVRRAWFLGLEGHYRPALQEAALATHEATRAVRRLAELPPAPPGRPWEGLSVPPWVPIDQANLDAAARTLTHPSGRETYRSWLTARALVGTALALAAPMRPTGLRRALAFAVDLGILALLMTGADLIVLGSVGGRALAPVLDGFALDAAVVGGVGWGLLYFVVLEGLVGATPGKRLLGLRVTSRRGGPADPRALVLRNLPRIVPLTLLAYVLGLSAAVVLFPATAGAVLAGYGGSFGFLAELSAVAALGFGLTGLVSVLTIGATEEGQRLGDLVAGTWVVRAERPRAPARAPGAAAATRPGAG